MALDYWVLVPTLAEQNVSGTVKDQFVVSVQQGSPVDNTLLNTDSGKVTVNGKSGYRRAGPFTSQADVNAYLKTGAQPVSGPIPGITINPDGSTSGPLSGIAGVADSIAKLAGTIKGIFDALTDWKMWASLGWIALGVFLIILAFMKITHATTVLEKGVGNVAKGFVA